MGAGALTAVCCGAMAGTSDRVVRSCLFAVTLLASSSGCAAAAASAAASSSKPPNLIIFLADNLGWGDIGAYGQPSARTPAIDGLVAEGMKFLDWNSAAAVCSPSRACLLTGRLAVRTGVYPMTFQANALNGLPRNETTLAEHLSRAGYSTKMVGKVRGHLHHSAKFGCATLHGWLR